ncbi:MAG: hypothetical protein LJE84_03515 [Gammaproteobacteria bacterium]|nr:hypothetical protein [Gammaproteobacteria bacterium]
MRTRLLQTLLAVLLGALWLPLPANASADNPAGVSSASQPVPSDADPAGQAVRVRTDAHHEYHGGTHWRGRWGVGVYRGRPYYRGGWYGRPYWRGAYVRPYWRGAYVRPYRRGWYPPIVVAPYAYGGPDPDEYVEDEAADRCREIRRYETTATIDGKTVPLHGLLCLGKDGKWHPLNQPG